jgi:hypothetical protein
MIKTLRTLMEPKGERNKNVQQFEYEHKKTIGLNSL